jgi:imidazoleglycerol-phosphate dehydratase / histidinol-phosphatase
MKKVLFIDRDGTILKEPEDEQVDSLEKLAFLPFAITSLSNIYKQLDYEFVMVTNQDGLGTSSFPEETFWPAQNMMVDILKGEGIIFSEIFIDRSFPEEKAPTRKPGTALLTKYLASGVDLSSSYVIGDRLTDVELAKNLGCKAILVGSRQSDDAVLSTNDWNEVFRYLRSIPRRSVVERITRETNIRVELDLDGTGKSDIKTGIGFFDHLLEQIPNHGKVDLKIDATGDLHVDEHHTIEDIALALGSAFYGALGKKKGITRYGFILPMDDSLAQVAIDFGGRPWLEWNAEFTREKVGELPTEMFSHFFRSFCDTAKCNLNISATGENEHHKIESVFKAFSKAMAMAIKQTDNYSIPSSKGSL